MRCAACEHELEAFTGDVCPHCQHFAHPTRLGNFDRLELIKRGGMGSVYRARHPDLGTLVAIKTVHTHTGPDTLAERFEQEARLAARIPHAGVVRVFDYDCQEGRLYLVMEFIDGETLRPVIDTDSHDIAWRLDKVVQLLDILQAAHDQGIVHRDVKPENVMVDATGRVRVLDFGISRVLDGGERLTQTGEILGTPEYIAPEQILDVPEAVDARTDIYATGVLLYELLTGRSPFAGSNLFQVLKNVESLEPPPPSGLRPGIAPELDALVMECMARDREQRPPDARTVARRLRQLLPTAAPAPAGSRFGGWAVALLCALAGWFAGRGLDTPADPATVGSAPPTAAQSIAAVLGGPPPIDRGALAAASHRIAGDAPAADRYWRGRARTHTGALLLARRDFEAARDAGHAPARAAAAVLWIYQHKLLPMVLASELLAAPATIDVAGDDELARCFEALASNDYQTALAGLGRLQGVLEPADQAVLVALCRSRLAPASAPAPAPKVEDTSYLPMQLLAAALAGEDRVAQLIELLPGIDRLAPTRYFVEAAIAAAKDDPPRVSAALELAQVTGEAEFAMAVFVALQLARFDRIDPATRRQVAAMAAELRGPAAKALRRALEKVHGGR